MTPRMLTPRELSELPTCRASMFGSCDRIDFDKLTPNDCVKCQIQLIFDSLRDKDIAGATHNLDSLIFLLEVMEVIKVDRGKKRTKEE